MAEEKIWELGIDGSSALATLAEIDAAFTSLSEKISQTAASAVDLSVFDDILSAIGELTSIVAGGFDALDSSIQAVDTSVTQAVGELETLTTSIFDLVAAEDEAAEGADAAASQISLLGSVGEAAGGALEGLQAAQGPLMMISAAAILGGKSMFDMGTEAQSSLSIVKGMAGATDQDIQTLEDHALNLGVNMKQAGDGMYFVASAGYAGKDGVEVLDNSIKAAKASGSQMTDTANALTSILHAYNLSAKDSGSITDQMTQTVVQGKQSFSDFASSIGPLAATAATVGVSFDQLTAAEATMTQINPHVKQDANQLSFLMTAVAGNIDKTAKTAEDLGLTFDKNTYSSLDFIGKLQYLQQQSGGNITAFTKLTGGTAGFKAAMDILSNSGDTYRNNLKAIQSSQGATDKAFAQSETTVSSHLDKMGAAFSLFATKVIDAIGPKLTPIIDNVTKVIGNVMDAILHHTDAVLPILGALAAIIGGAVVGAVVSLVISMAPVLLTLLLIGAAVAGVIYAFQHWTDIVKTTQGILANPVISTIIHYFQELGAYLASIFVPVWNELVGVWQSQVLPAIQRFVSAFQMLTPVLQAVGAIVGAVLGVIVLVAIANVVGMINGLIHAFAAIVSGASQMLGGVVTAFSGLVQMISAFLRIIYDLVTGNFGHIGADLQAFGSGFIAIFVGLFNFTVGLFRAFFGSIIAGVSGFVQGVIGFFTHLADILVGHSIIPDMVMAIVGWIASLPGRIVQFGAQMITGFAGAISGAIGNVQSAVTGIINTITSTISSLPGKALEWGTHMVQGFASGITNAIGGIAHAASSIASIISSWLHFSVPDEGPLSTSDQWMNDFGTMLSDGINEQSDKVRKSSNNVANSIKESDLTKLAEVGKRIVESFGAIAAEIHKTFEPITKALDDLVKLGQKVGDLDKETNRASDGFKRLALTIIASIQPAGAAAQAFHALKPAMDASFTAIRDGISHFEKLEPAFKKVEGPIQRAVDELKKIGDGIQKATAPIDKSVKELQNLDKTTMQAAQAASKASDDFKKLTQTMMAIVHPAVAIVQALTTLKPAMDTAFQAVSNAIPQFQKLEPAFKSIEGPIQKAVDELKKIGDGINKAIAPVDKAIKGLENLDRVTLQMAQAAAAADKAFADTALALQKDKDESEKTVKAFQAIEPAINQAKKAVSDSQTVFRNFADELKKSEGPLKNAVDSFRKVTDEINKVLKPVDHAIGGLTTMRSQIAMMGSAVQAFVQAFNALPGSIDKSHKSSDDLTKSLKDLQLALNKAANEAKTSTPLFKDIAPAIDKARDPLHKVVDGYKQVTQALKAVFDPIVQSISVLKELKDIIEDIFAPVTKATDNFTLLAPAITALHDPITQLGDAIQDLSTRVDDSTRKINSAFDDTGRKFGDFGRQTKQTNNDIISAIKDMVNAFVDQFNNLHTQVTGKVQSLFQFISRSFSAWAPAAYTWGSDMLSQFIAGIQSQEGSLEAEITNIANEISSQLHHSKPEKGPLADDDQWMPDFGATLVTGLNAQADKVQVAAGNVARSIATVSTPLAPSVAAPPSLLAPSPGLGDATTVSILSQMLTVLNAMYQHQQARGGASTTINNTISTQQNIQSLFNAIQSLGGYSYEITQRGAY